MLAMHCLTYLALEALVRYLALKITALELFFGSMICLFNLRLWTGFLCVLRLCFVWPVQGHETWHTVLFLIWFGYPCSWLWHVFLQLIQLMPKHIIYSTVCLVSGDLKLVIALYLYHGVNASGFQQFIGCLNLFLFLIAANLSLYCVVSYGSQRWGYVHCAFRM